MYRLDHTAIKHAADFLSLTHPVYVQTTRQVTRWNGAYRGLRRRPIGGKLTTPPWPELRHVISLDATVSTEQANRTLWHELAHAMQCERFPTSQDFILAYNLEARSRRCVSRQTSHSIARYREISFEVEAREYECLAETDPLVKGAIHA